ncbi:MAG: putative transcriptional regulator [Bacteroidetes bacterium]|nr:MAG: putative transcriptional regulator [Bacteroidota bacterium]
MTLIISGIFRFRVPCFHTRLTGIKKPDLDAPDHVYTFVQMLPVENKLEPKQGRLLIAEPFLNDGYFKRAVVLLVEHNKQGSLGFMLNRPMEITINEALPDFPEYSSSLYLGGPVQRDQLFYIHALGDKIEGSLPIGKNLWWNGSFDTIREMIANKTITPNQLRFFVGYSGWEPGQLQKEMEEKSWYVAKSTPELIFSEDDGKLWTNAVKSMGKPFSVMVNFPEDPSLN